MQCNNDKNRTPAADDRRPSFFALVGLFALALFIGNLLAKLGLFRTSFAVAGSVGFFSALVIGLVAASSSCMAVSGGLLLATAAKFRSRLRPVLLFTAGRVASYALLGGAIGAIGKNISFSPLVSGAITTLAALVMLCLGLDMLKLLPKGLKKLMPRMPAFVARKVMNAESSVHPAAPLMLGAGTFFLPCGFTQALQIYALSSGSFSAGALALGGFALGTAPSLIALGWFAGSWKGSTGRFFFRFAGAAVVLLGIANIGNGLNLIGWTPVSGNDQPAALTVPVDRGSQTIKMSIGPSGYSPASFTIPAGRPIRWEIDASHAGGCQMSIVSRQLNLQKYLAAGDNLIEFVAPAQLGTYQFSCPMGMYRGQFNVVSS